MFKVQVIFFNVVIVLNIITMKSDIPIKIGYKNYYNLHGNVLE